MLLLIAYLVGILYFFSVLTEHQTNTEDYAISLAAAVAFPIYVLGKLWINYKQLINSFENLFTLDTWTSSFQHLVAPDEVTVLGEDDLL